MFTPLTFKQATKLRSGQIIYLDPKIETNSDGTCQRFKVTSVKLWKRNPDRIEVRLQRGLYQYARLGADQLSQFSLNEV